MTRILPAGAFVVATTLALAALATPYEQQAVGFVFVTRPVKLDIYEQPDATSKAIAHAPNAARLVFKKTMVEGDKPVWYLVQPIGYPPGWVSAADVSAAPPTPIKPGASLKLVDSGLGNAHATPSMTLAAHGMDERAKKFGESQNMKLTVDQFLTLEASVENLFNDAHEADGSYPEKGETAKSRAEIRSEHARKWKAGVR